MLRHLKSYTLLLALITLLACNSNDSPLIQEEEPIEPNPRAVDTVLTISNLEQAKLNYRIHCGGCHGQSMESFVERDWQYGATYNEVKTSIMDGYEATGMPAYAVAFSDTAVNDLTLYILESIQGKTKQMLLDENPDLGGIIESDDLSFRVETLTDQISGIPWAIDQLPDYSLLVTERSGTLYRLSQEGELTSIDGLPSIYASGQGGLLDVEVHPDFETNDYIYLSYSKRNPQNSSQSTTAVIRGKLQGNSLQSLEELFVAEPYINSTRHFGSRLLFDRDGYLYVSIGDRGQRDTYPQALNNHHGKVHRLHDDGSIPVDNPFVNDANAENSVFAYGIRNPQGLSLHPETGKIWEGEHGPQGGDEINILEAGKNYGWPVISYGINYNGTTFTDLTEKAGMEQPEHYWVPSIAPCGMDFLGSDFYGSWKNDLFVSSLKFKYLHRVKMNGSQVTGHEELLNDAGRVRDVQNGIDGYLYVAVESPGRVLRLVPEN